MALWLFTGHLDPVFLAAIVGGFAAFAGIGWWFSPYQRTLRALRAAPVVRVAEASDGTLVRIVGTLRAGERTLLAPLTGRTCAHFLALVEERVSTGKSHSWRERAREQDTCEFLVEDASGTAIVRAPHGLVSAVVIDHQTRSGTFDAPTEEQIAFLSRHDMQSTGMLGFERALRYREGVLEPGERVAVLGRARWEDDPDEGAALPGAGYRDARRKKRLIIEPTDDGKLHASDDPASLR